MEQTYQKNKKVAIALRRQGYSYNLVLQKVKVSKSTLSLWLRDVPYEPNAKVKKRIKMGPYESGKKRHEAKLREIEKIKNQCKKEMGRLSERDLWMLGIGLYLGEGSKSYEIIRVINSDPRIIKLAIKWFKSACKIRNENISLRLHLYPDNDLKLSTKYWSEQINLPVSQFKKVQIDQRANKSDKKKNKLPFGTAHLTIISKGNPDFGVKLHRKIIGWLECALEQNNIAGVV